MAQTGSSRMPDEEFLAYAKNINEQAKKMGTDWFIDDKRLSPLTGLLENAQKAYNENSNPMTRNRATAIKKNETFGELKHFLSLFINYVESTDTVPDWGLELMRLRPRSHPGYHPLPVPAEAPIMVIKQQHDEIIVYVTRIELGEPAADVQLKPYHGFMLKWKFEEEEDWNIEISTRLHYTLFFDTKDEARRVVLAAAWVNPRLQPGPWTDFVTKVIG
jgi:hypothetical protein